MGVGGEVAAIETASPDAPPAALSWVLHAALEFCDCDDRGAGEALALDVTKHPPTRMSSIRTAKGGGAPVDAPSDAPSTRDPLDHIVAARRGDCRGDSNKVACAPASDMRMRAQPVRSAVPTA